MGRLTVTTFVSIDGVMQAPGGVEEDRSDGFDKGGWMVPFFDEDFGGVMDPIFRTPDAFLLGRRTYQIFETYWPKMTDPADPVASKLNNLPKYVASRTLTKTTWTNSHLLGPDVPGEIRALKHRYGELQVHGSAGLLQTLLTHDLVDEFHLLVFPVVIGSGRRLFGTGAVPATMELVTTRPTSKGAIYANYRRVSAGITQGTFGT